ncbi:carbonic anhydrase [Niallia sp. 03133]|uniref:carbonic anhydrase n=1 Tax=Niallia sp. 03133 TaxID=3458060 RepID=UPI0040450F6C
MQKRVLLGMLVLMTFLGTSACVKEKASIDTGSKINTVSATEVKNEEHLDYSDQKDWDFESGDMQSPIDIDLSRTEKMIDDGNLDLKYGSKISYIEDNGHSIQVGGSGPAMIDGRHFEFIQVHFHAQSEHTINGVHYPIEAHFVNSSQDGRIAVIGVFFKEGTENKIFGDILSNIQKGKKNTSVSPINLKSMLPENNSYYHYLGSLTTPPLNENVEWYVMSTPIEVSKIQIEEFNQYYDSNNRDIQKLNDRHVLEHKEK